MMNVINFEYNIKGKGESSQQIQGHGKQTSKILRGAVIKKIAWKIGEVRRF